MSLELKRYLFDAYGGCADRRILNPEKANTFIIDDRQPGEYPGANGNGNGNGYGLGNEFCRMFARVEGEDQVVLSLHENAPLNEEVKRIIHSRGGQTGEHFGCRRVSVRIRATDSEFVRNLADAIRHIVDPTTGGYYPPSYEKTCPRVASNLERFAQHLDQYAATRPIAPRLLAGPVDEGHQIALPYTDAPGLEQQIARLERLVRHAENVMASMSFSGGRRPVRQQFARHQDEAHNEVLREIFKANLALHRSMEGGPQKEGGQDQHRAA